MSATEDPSLSKPDSQQDWGSFGYTFLTNACVSVVMLCLFEVVRNSKRYYGLYRIRVVPAFHAKFPRLQMRPPPPYPRRPFQWLRTDLSDHELYRNIGLDGYIVIRFCRLGLKICLFGTIGFLLLTPFYASGDDTAGHSGPARLTIVQLTHDSNTMWVAVVWMWIFSMHVIRMLRDEYARVLALRLDFLVAGDCSTDAQATYTVLVQRLPKQCRTPSMLHAFYDAIFPGRVYSTSVARASPKLTRLLAQREAALRGLEKAAQVKHVTGVEPTVRTWRSVNPAASDSRRHSDGRYDTESGGSSILDGSSRALHGKARERTTGLLLCLCGRKVPATGYYKERLDSLTDEIVEKYERLCTKVGLVNHRLQEDLGGGLRARSASVTPERSHGGRAGGCSGSGAAAASPGMNGVDATAALAAVGSSASGGGRGGFGGGFGGGGDCGGGGGGSSSNDPAISFGLHGGALGSNGRLTAVSGPAGSPRLHGGLSLDSRASKGTAPDPAVQARLLRGYGMTQSEDDVGVVAGLARLARPDSIEIGLSEWGELREAIQANLHRKPSVAALHGRGLEKSRASRWSFTAVAEEPSALHSFASFGDDMALPTENRGAHGHRPWASVGGGMLLTPARSRSIEPPPSAARRGAAGGGGGDASSGAAVVGGGGGADDDGDDSGGGHGSGGGGTDDGGSLKPASPTLHSRSRAAYTSPSRWPGDQNPWHTGQAGQRGSDGGGGGGDDDGNVIHEVKLWRTDTMTGRFGLREDPFGDDKFGVKLAWKRCSLKRIMSFLLLWLVEAVETVTGEIQVLTFGTSASTGFVTFTNLVTAAEAAQVRVMDRPGMFIAAAAPEPRDLVWRNVPHSLFQIQHRSFVVDILLFVAACYWSELVSAVISATDKLIETEPVKSWVTGPNAAFALALFANVLPSAILLLTIALLSPVLMIIAHWYEGYKSLSEMHEKTLWRLYWFQVTNAFVLITNISITDLIQNLITQPVGALEKLGLSIPQTSVYSMSIVLSKLTFGLLGPEIFKYHLFLLFTGRSLLHNPKMDTPRERREGFYQPCFAFYPTIYAGSLLVLLLCCVYQSTAPYVTVVGVLYFYVAEAVMKYNFLYLYLPQFATGGRAWELVYWAVLISLISAQIVTAGFAYASFKDSHMVMALAPLPFLVIYLGFKFRFLYRATDLPLNRAVEQDRQGYEVDLRDRRAAAAFKSAAAAAAASTAEAASESAASFDVEARPASSAEAAAAVAAVSTVAAVAPVAAATGHKGFWRFWRRPVCEHAWPRRISSTAAPPPPSPPPSKQDPATAEVEPELEMVHPTELFAPESYLQPELRTQLGQPELPDGFVLESTDGDGDDMDHSSRSAGCNGSGPRRNGGRRSGAVVGGRFARDGDWTAPELRRTASAVSAGVFASAQAWAGASNFRLSPASVRRTAQSPLHDRVVAPLDGSAAGRGNRVHRRAGRGIMRQPPADPPDI